MLAKKLQALTAGRGRVLCAVAAVLLMATLFLVAVNSSPPPPGPPPTSFPPLMKHGAVLQCLEDPKMSITKMDTIIYTLSICEHESAIAMVDIFRRIFDFTKTQGAIVMPNSFRPKVEKWLGNDPALIEEVQMQTISTVYNRITHESAVLNPLRARRPGVGKPAEGAEKYVDALVENTRQDCDFCRFQQQTAMEGFGRIVHEHTMTAANTFKYDAAHGLVMLAGHHPLKWSRAEFLELMHTVQEWFTKANMASPNLVYPHWMWDILPKASASQIHPHIQASISQYRYYGAAEHLRLAAEDYKRRHGENYFTHLVQVHEALGLTVRLGRAVAMAYLTARKDWEVMIVAPTANDDFALLLHYCLRAYIDEFKLLALSIAAYYPSVSGAHSLPAIVRFVDRGAVDTMRSDISAMELFGQANVNIDPFSVAARLRVAVTAAIEADRARGAA